MANKPRQKSIKDYAKDFLGGLMGRKQPEQSQQSEERSGGLLGRTGDRLREQAEQMRQRAEELRRQQSGETTTTPVRPEMQTPRPQMGPQPTRPGAQAPSSPSSSASRPEEGLSETMRGTNKSGSPSAEQSREVGGTSARRSYTVAYGDSLSAIALRYYGDAMQWKRIYEANRDKISNPDLIHPGQELVIP